MITASPGTQLGVQIPKETLGTSGKGGKQPRPANEPACFGKVATTK